MICFFRIYDNAYSTYYLNDLSIRGTDYVSAYKSSHKNQVNYFALHGCIRNPGEYVFGATEIASAFSNAISKQSWTSLAKDAEEHAILFWGWNFEDSGPIEAMYGVKSHVNENIKKWALLYKPEEETIDFLSSLNFNIIIGETQDMLQYMQDFRKESSEKVEILSIGSPIKELDEFIYPAENAVASYPLKSFFCDYTPRWSYVYSKSIPSISFYKKIAGLIAAKRNVVFTGIRGSGKTTLLMQLIVNIETARLKHYMLAPTLESVEAYLKGLQNSQSLLFVDDCFRDTDAIVRLLRASNVQVVCCDRDFNFERQYHRIKPYNFETLDITGLTQEDAQAVINCIPMELKRSQLNTRKIEEDITLPNILASALKAQNYRYMQIFHESDSLAAEIFLMICYVHSCGVPCSFDMVYSYLGDEQYSWQNMLDAIQRVGKLIKDCENSSDYFGSYDIDYSLQDYYQCRSRFFAEKIIQSVPKGNRLLAKVLFDFVEFVPPFKICAYDKFKRSGYDADLASRAFTSFEEGKEFYEKCVLKDESEYIYQQAAIYFSRINEYKEAFDWIERARNLAHYNRFSIDSTYASIYFKVNVGIDSTECKQALNILYKCCTDDKRKAIHFSNYAKCVLEYAEKHSDDKENILDYIEGALMFVREGLDAENISLQTKNKWELKKLKAALKELKAKYPIN